MADLTATNPPLRIIEISPSAVLATIGFGALVFVAYLGSMGALVFLATGAVLILRQPGRILPEHLRHWAFYTLPIFCALSLLWSEVPSASLRFSVQLGLTFAVAIAIACKVRAPVFARILFALYLLAAIASLGAGSVRFDGAWLGVFGSKNAFAAVMATLVMLSAAFLFDKTAKPIWRWTALASLPIGLYMLIMAQSAGALILACLALALAPLLYFAARFSVRQKLVIALFAVLLTALALIAVFAFRDALFAVLLDYTGKDVTLTGRTDLWDVAGRLIAQRPFLGVGYQAFWVHGNPYAEMLWAMFGIDARSGFNFHNTYINNAVEIGLIGVALQVMILMAALWYALRWALMAPNATSVFFAIFMVQLIAGSFIEVSAFFQFNTRTILIIVCVIYGMRAVRAERAKKQTV